MTDNTLNLDALTEAFKADCKVIRLKYEYPGYTGTEKYAIISDLSYEQIVEKHAPVVKPYIPFLLLSKAAGEVIAEFKRNEDKFFRHRHPHRIHYSGSVHSCKIPDRVHLRSENTRD